MKKIWNWYYGKASIRKKLIISYLILVILPILVLGMYSYYVSKKKSDKTDEAYNGKQCRCNFLQFAK